MNKPFRPTVASPPQTAHTDTARAITRQTSTLHSGHLVPGRSPVSIDVSKNSTVTNRAGTGSKVVTTVPVTNAAAIAVGAPNVIFDDRRPFRG